MVPGSTLIEWSSWSIVTFSPRDSRMAASEAAAMPFPREETTPPVIKMYLVMRVPGQKFFVGHDDTVKRPAIKGAHHGVQLYGRLPNPGLKKSRSTPYIEYLKGASRNSLLRDEAQGATQRTTRHIG